MYWKVFEPVQGLRDWTIPEKIHTGGEGEDIENFQEYTRNRIQNFQGLIKNKVEFPRETKTNSCEISRVLEFLAFNFRGMYIILPNFQ